MSGSEIDPSLVGSKPDTDGGAPSDPARQIAEAVLYEGYVLWPYRRSAIKNQQRFTWGGVYPRGWPEGPSRLRAECLIEGEAPRVEATVRFLQVGERRAVDGDGAGVDELSVDGRRHLSWEEAVERQLVVDSFPGRTPIAIEAGSEREDIHGAEGPVGALLRRHRPLRGTVATELARVAPNLHRLRIQVANEAHCDGGDRGQVLKETLCSTHVALRCEGGEFVSLTDPPRRLRGQAERCRNQGLWPVLVGEPGERGAMLAAPIILEDYPRVAPESPGDLFDGAEIDQLLTLNILALSDEEKEEMRASDPRARQILERTEGMSGEQLMRLHGTIRDMRAVGR